MNSVIGLLQTAMVLSIIGLPMLGFYYMVKGYRWTMPISVLVAFAVLVVLVVTPVGGGR